MGMGINHWEWERMGENGIEKDIPAHLYIGCPHDPAAKLSD